MSKTSFTPPLNASMNLASPALILDTGATGHFISSNATTTPVQPAPHPITVQLPDHTTITSTHTTKVPALHKLPPSQQTAHVFPNLRTSLLSIGKLCDTGCTASFTKNHAQIHYNGKLLLQGTRTPNGLWTVTPSFDQVTQANNLTRI